MRRGIPWATPLLFVLAACGEGSVWGGAVVDSAGVRIVTNPAGTPVGGWRATEELVIAPDETRPETLFGRVVDLEVDGAGRLFVLDGAASEVRVFSPEGAWLQTLGGPGEGPGELSRFASSLVLLPGDTLLVVDWGNGRSVRFAPDGTPLGAIPLPGGTGSRSWWRPAHAGAVAMARVLERYTDETGVWRGHDVLVRIDDDLEVSDTVLTFVYPEADLGGPGAPKAPLIVEAPAWTALPDGGVAWTTLAGGEVRVHDRGGRLVRIVRGEEWRGDALSEAGRAELRGLLGRKLEELGGDPAVVDRLDVTAPDRFPTLAAVRSGPDATLWVQRAGSPATTDLRAVNDPGLPEGFGGRRWDVIDSAGRMIGRVQLPWPVRVTRIRDGRMVGVARDELGVERVVVFRLERGG